MLRGQHVKTTVLEPAPSFHRSVQLRHKGLHCPGHVNCLVPELEQEPNSPKLVFFPLSTASSSSLMCFYYKIKVCQSQAFCRFFFPLKLILPIIVHVALDILCCTPSCISLEFIALRAPILFLLYFCYVI